MSRKFALVVVLVTAPFVVSGQNDWRTYGNDAGHTRFSTLTQITPENVARLTKAWEFDTSVPGRKWQNTPVVVNGTMYITLQNGGVVALAPETGKEIWRYETPVRGRSLRAVSYWPGDAEAGSRLLYGAGDRLIALDPKTGALITSFGDKGVVNVHPGQPSRPVTRSTGPTEGGGPPGGRGGQPAGRGGPPASNTTSGGAPTGAAPAARAASAPTMAAPAQEGVSDAKGRALLEQVCTTCHGVETVENGGRTAEQWREVINEMIGLGATPSDAEARTLVDYLSRRYPLRVNVNSASARQIAEALEIPMPQAVAIVEHRERAGSFKTWQDVAKVPGVDAATIEQRQGRLVF
jgi:competence ComEA-like helix-hairpin-helix protein